MIDHDGILYCGNRSTIIPSAKTFISAEGFNLADCLIPQYLQNLPFDPSKEGAHYSSATDFDTKYSIDQDAYGHINLYADAEATSSIIKISR